MDANRHEFRRIETMAEDMGVYFRFDAGIIPQLDGNVRPVQHRMAPEEAVEREFENPKRARAWTEFWMNRIQAAPVEKRYICGAGKKSFHITSDGFLRPCMMVTEPSCDLRSIPFLDGWRHHFPKLDELPLGMGSPCRTCDLIDLCGYCPPLFHLENSSCDSSSEFLCRIGRSRRDRITGLSILSDTKPGDSQ
jgi:radical SAM protein with 4Fe4S-binding SPASM domain